MSYLANIAARNAPADASALQPVLGWEAVSLHDPFTATDDAAPAPTETLPPHKIADSIQPIKPTIIAKDNQKEILVRQDVNPFTPEHRKTPQEKQISFAQVVQNRMMFADKTTLNPIEQVGKITPNEIPVAEHFTEREHATHSEQTIQKNSIETLHSKEVLQSVLMQPTDVNAQPATNAITLLQPQQKEQPTLPKLATAANATETRQEPKLTIGKITVEIVAPEKPSRQTPPSAGIQLPPRPVSNWNKHSAGLSQF